MEKDILVQPRWNFKDVLLSLAVVFAGSYGAGSLILFFIAPDIDLAGRYLVAGTIQAILFLGTVLLIIFIKYGGGLHQLGLSRSLSSDKLEKGIIGGVVLFIIVLVTGAFVSVLMPIEPKPQPFAELLLNADSPFEILVPFFIGGILAPLGEEVYFRGFTYPVFKQRFGALWGIGFSAVFFALLHFDPIRFLPLALGGAGLAWLYEKTGSLFVPIIAHSIWNTGMLGLLLITSRLQGTFF